MSVYSSTPDLSSLDASVPSPPPPPPNTAGTESTNTNPSLIIVFLVVGFFGVCLITVFAYRRLTYRARLRERTSLAACRSSCKAGRKPLLWDVQIDRSLARLNMNTETPPNVQSDWKDIFPLSVTCNNTFQYSPPSPVPLIPPSCPPQKRVIKHTTLSTKRCNPSSLAPDPQLQSQTPSGKQKQKQQLQTNAPKPNIRIATLIAMPVPRHPPSNSNTGIVRVEEGGEVCLGLTDVSCTRPTGS